MSGDDRSITAPSDRSDRPYGVWFFTIGNAVLAAFLFLLNTPVLLNPSADRWPSAVKFTGPLNAILMLAICVAAYGAWAGNRQARTALLALLTVLSGLFVSENAQFVYFLNTEFHPDKNWTWMDSWWELSSGVRWILWLTINYWYFLGSQARDFYSSR